MDLLFNNKKEAIQPKQSEESYTNEWKNDWEQYSEKKENKNLLWEEDGHFWTVYVLGILMGLTKERAFELAKNAEFYDHTVEKDKNNNMKMSIQPHKSGLSWGKDGGLGTWADPDLQGDWHGLTGGFQKSVNSRAKSKILKDKDLNYLHTLGDSWAHSYLNDKNQRVMYGNKGDNDPWHSGITRFFLGDITFEHAKGGPEHGKIADNIADRPKEYKFYINDLKNVFNNTSFIYHNEIKNFDPDLRIFDYAQKHGKNKDDNVFIFKSFIEYLDGKCEFYNLSENEKNLLEGMLNYFGSKYKTTEFSAFHHINDKIRDTREPGAKKEVKMYFVKL